MKALRFKDKCFTSLEFYSLKDVFKSLADQQGSVRYLKEETVARYLEIPDILGASPVVFQMVSYLGAFPFLQDAPVVLELPQMIMVIVIMTERYKRVLARGSADRTKLIFKSLAVYDRKATAAETSQAPAVSTDKNGAPRTANGGGFTVDLPGEDESYDGVDELVLTAYELLDIHDAVKQGSAPEFHGAIIPTDNFRKLIMLLLLAAPLDAQESMSQYSDRAAGTELERLRATAECILASFVDVETAPGIKYRQFKTVIPILFPNLFNSFNALFEHFLFSKNLDFSKSQKDARNQDPPASKAAQPLLSDQGDILNDHMLSQMSFFLPGSSLFRRARRLYSGNDAGFSMGGFDSKVLHWRAPTILLVSGTILSDVPSGGQEASFADSLPIKRFRNGTKGGRVTYGVYVREPWKHTHKECFGDSETVLFQLEPVHDVFPASTINTDYVAFTKPPGNQACLTFGAPHPKPRKSSRPDTNYTLGAVSLLLNDSFEFGVFNHDHTSRGGAFHTSILRKYDFQDRFEIDGLEVWGCGGDDEAKAQAERWAWQEEEAESRRRINLGTGDIETDRSLLEMAGLVGANRTGGSMA